MFFLLIQIQNHFPMPLDVSYLNKDDKPVKLTTIDADSIFAVPLLPAYHSSFYIKPAGFGYVTLSIVEEGI